MEPLVVRAARVGQFSQTFEFKNTLGCTQVVCSFTRYPNISHLGSDFLLVHQLEIVTPLSIIEFQEFLQEFQKKFAEDCYQIMFSNTSPLAAAYLKDCLGQPARVGLGCELTPSSHKHPSQHST